MGHRDSYARIGLARNPFTAEGIPEVPEPLWIDRGFSVPPPRGARLLVQVIGEKGWGKSAHLLHWRARTGGPYRRIPPDARRLFPLPIAPIAYWDEADRIPSWLLAAGLRLAGRIGGTVVIGTHRDLAAHARSAGLSVLTHPLPPISPDELLAWAARRIELAAIPGVTPLPFPRTVSAQVAAEAGGSWRAAADRLHVWAATEAAKGGSLP